MGHIEGFEVDADLVTEGLRVARDIAGDSPDADYLWSGNEMAMAHYCMYAEGKLRAIEEVIDSITFDD